MKKIRFILLYSWWSILARNGIPSSYADVLMVNNHLGIKVVFIFIFIFLFHNYLFDRLKETSIFEIIKIGILATFSIVMSIVVINLIITQEISFVANFPLAFRTFPMIFDVLIVGSIFEEMFYRFALIYTGEKKYLKMITAIVSLFFFTMNHSANANGQMFNLIPFLIIGVVLTITYLWKRNIWHSICAHIIYNTTIMLLAVWL